MGGVTLPTHLGNCYPSHMTFEPPTSAENNSSTKSPAKSGKKLTYLSLVLSVVAILLSIVAIGSSEESPKVIETATPIATWETPDPGAEEKKYGKKVLCFFRVADPKDDQFTLSIKRSFREVSYV